MDKLPSRHAISEVMSWIALMESVIEKDEEDIKNAVGYKAVHDYLQKYKVTGMDLFIFIHVDFYLKALRNSNQGLECMYPKYNKQTEAFKSKCVEMLSADAVCQLLLCCCSRIP